MTERSFLTVADAVKLVTREPMMDQEAEARMEAEGASNTLRNIDLARREGPVKIAIPVDPAREQARADALARIAANGGVIGKRVLVTMGEVGPRVGHRPPTAGSERGV